MAAQTLSFAGEVLIKEVTIVTTKGFIQNITNQVAGVQVYEDIFQPFLSGVIYVKEYHDFVNLFPLVGEEIVRIELQTPSLDDEYTFKGEFYIWKMNNRFKSNQKELGYALHFVSKEAVVDINKKISKTFSGKISDTVKTLVTSDIGLESKKTLNVEDSINSTKHISNFWAPTKNIEYLAKQAINANKSPTFLFFETQFGLNFVSLESLIKLPTFQNFVQDNYSADFPTADGGSFKNPEDDYHKILDMATPETFDYMKRIKSGLYASRIQYYDVVSKKYTDRTYIASDHADKQTHLNKYTIATGTTPAKPNALIIKDHKYYANFNGYGDVTNVRTLQERLSLLDQINAFKLEITVFGRFDYCVGQVIEIRVFKNTQLIESDDPEQQVDEMYSGKYLVSALTHNVDREKHEITMEIIKDSFIRELK
mgnify:CR=1 FL=1